MAEALGQHGFATLLFDLLTEAEASDRRNVFDIPLFARRIAATVEWISAQADIAGLSLCLFGASTRAAAALGAAAAFPVRCKASWRAEGGRIGVRRAAAGQGTDAAHRRGGDTEVLHHNEAALRRLTCPARLAVVEGATHLFEEPGALDKSTRLAASWFSEHLSPVVVSRG